jgi:hypothetical protein
MMGQAFNAGSTIHTVYSGIDRVAHVTYLDHPSVAELNAWMDGNRKMIDRACKANSKRLGMSHLAKAPKPPKPRNKK